ncbi:transglutaminase-like cysteine peptidase [uncultured Amphritea sp.]|uniref:transglutaminase-like cysteine peptidase n=1 Tax=uncultured Amphritea sp. TaxID=981605 RepID=UPI0025F97479|nr:transglutaminase-like cysteine peptidase [uncultured Amphritea sp.]
MTADLKAILDEVLEATHQRFTYRSDADVWAMAEHWETYEQIPSEGPFSGDCDAFAMACRKAVMAKGIKSRLVLCGVNDARGDHLILECQGWLLDNRSFHVTSWEDSEYTLISISGENPGDAWHQIVKT